MSRPSAGGHTFTACFILFDGAPSRDRILDEIRSHIEFDATPSPLSRGPVFAVDIPLPPIGLDERSTGGLLAQTLAGLPCGAIVEWLVPQRDSARAFGMHGTWVVLAASDAVEGHSDLVELDGRMTP